MKFIEQKEILQQLLGLPQNSISEYCTKTCQFLCITLNGKNNFVRLKFQNLCKTHDFESDEDIAYYLYQCLADLKIYYPQIDYYVRETLKIYPVINQKITFADSST